MNDQEDKYLLAFAAENATQVRDITEMLAELGLSYNEELELSDDYAVLAKEGMWWPAPWLVLHEGNAWFVADIDAPAG